MRTFVEPEPTMAIKTAVPTLDARLGSAGSRVKPSTKLDQAQKVLRASADCATALLDLPLAPAPIDYQSPMDFKRSRDKAE